jgi:hypothetical protein
MCAFIARSVLDDLYILNEQYMDRIFIGGERYKGLKRSLMISYFKAIQVDAFATCWGSGKLYPVY